MCICEGNNYYNDTARIINKFDIYVCDLGDFEDIGDSSLLGKKRPCVIVSSDDINNPNLGTYLIAPIRTEHNIEVSRETLENIVAERRKWGRIYVPIEMRRDDFRFIDITQIRPIHISKIKYYDSSIINSALKMKINASIMEACFSRDEFLSGNSKNRVAYNTCTHRTYDGSEALISNSDGTVTCRICGDTFKSNVQIKEIETAIEEKDETESQNIEKVGEKSKKKKERRKSSFPMGFSKYYQLYTKGQVTVLELVEIFNIPRSTMYSKLKRFGELHPELNKH